MDKAAFLLDLSMLIRNHEIMNKAHSLATEHNWSDDRRAYYDMAVDEYDAAMTRFVANWAPKE